jgi:hypothetical protein
MDLHHSYKESRLERYYNDARRIIQEAGNIPLHLAISGPGRIYRPPIEHNDDSFYGSDGEDALTEHDYESLPGLIEFVDSTRGWEAAEIDLHDHLGFAQDVLHCEPGEPPLETWMRLRSLSLISDWRNVPPEGEENYDCGPLRMTGESFPLLRAVTLHLKCCNVSDWTLPWAQLTCLALEQLANPLSWCLEILGQCTALQTFNLTIGGIHDREPDGRGEGRVTVPRLQFISIDVSDAHCDLPKSFFDKVQLPALRSLEIKDRYSSDSDFKAADPIIDSLRRCFRRSRCSIQHLSLEIKNMKLKKEALSRLLKSTPSLRSLDLGIGATDVTRKYIRSLRMENLEEVIVDLSRARTRARGQALDYGYPYYSD